jgi:alkanesulfonate monooxygenase SsuD/methylene tetrahydromethanopterin reductase-like flavin-dependent oxidoreductase (luciferase family)
MAPVPPEPIPVWVGGRSAAALRRAARHDGFIPSIFDVKAPDEVLAASLATIRDDRERAGRTGPFACCMPWSGPRVPETAAQLEARGATATTVQLWRTGSDGGELAAKHEAVARFATDVIEGRRG